MRDRQPDRQQDAERAAGRFARRLPPGHRRQRRPRRRAVGRARDRGVPGHARRHAHLRPRRRPFGVGVPAAGGRQRQLQGLRRDSRTRRRRSSCSPRSRASSTSATGCAPARSGSSRRRSASSASASRWATASYSHLRVPGLLPRRRIRSRPSSPIVDAPAAKVIEAPWYEFKWFANDESARFEMVLALRRVRCC